MFTEDEMLIIANTYEDFMNEFMNLKIKDVSTIAIVNDNVHNDNNRYIRCTFKKIKLKRMKLFKIEIDFSNHIKQGSIQDFSNKLAIVKSTMLDDVKLLAKRHYKGGHIKNECQI